MWKSVAVIAAVLVLAGSCGAVDLKYGNTVFVPKNEKANDDILAAGSQVAVEAPVDGDVTAGGQTVQVLGPVEQTAMLAGNEVNLAGGVGNDAWLAGQTVNVTSRIADNAYMAGSTVNLSKDAAIGKDLLVAGGSVSVLGPVDGSMRAAAGDLTIGGRVKGSVYARVQRLHLLKDAQIDGGLFYESPTLVSIDPGARVLGATKRTIPRAEEGRPLFWSATAWWLGKLIAAVIFGVVMIVLFPVRCQATADTARTSIWSSLGIGFVVLVATPIACVVAALTGVGIPVALAVLVTYIILLYASGVFSALAIGQMSLARARHAQTTPNPYSSMILGLVIISLVGLLPYIGWLVRFLVVLAGFGAFLTSWWRSPAD